MASKESMRMVWRVLTEIYGGAFRTPYGDSPNESWTYIMKDLTDENVNFGIREVFNNSPKFPPNGFEFRDLCYGITDEVMQREVKAHMPPSFDVQRMTYNQLDKAEKKARSKAIAAIKKKLNGDPTTYIKPALTHG